MVRRDGDIVASDDLVAYHTACHGQSFHANDYLLTLIKKMYERKFSSALTQSEAIITSVLSPYILGEVMEDLNRTKSIAVSLGASKKDFRIFPVAVQNILSNYIVQKKITNFLFLPGETSDLTV
jgi:hypothetical protein